MKDGRTIMVDVLGRM